MLSLFKKFFCKHDNSICLTNCYGDYIDVASNYKFPTIRSIWQCKDCGKIVKSQHLNKECPIVNWDIHK